VAAPPTGIFEDWPPLDPLEPFAPDDPPFDVVESLIVDPPVFVPPICCKCECIPGVGVGVGVLAADAATGARNGAATAPAINTARSPRMCVDIVHLPSRGPAGPPDWALSALPCPFPGRDTPGP
jgi:hypothetical protein